MLTRAGRAREPTGGAGFACPPGDLKLDDRQNFLAMTSSSRASSLCRIRSRPAPALEDVDHDLELLAVGVHVVISPSKSASGPD